MATKTADPKSAVQEALAALRKKDATIKIGSLADADQNSKEVFSTGNILLNDALSVGGFPYGRVIELFGLSQSGKTTASLMTAALHQKAVKAGFAKGAILFLDYERSIDEKYAKQLGLDVDDAETFIYMKPKSLEQGANTFRALMDAGILAFCIIDSVAAMVSEKELEAETGKATMADRAKALHQFFRQVTGKMEEGGVSLIMLNHVMEKIDITPMGQRAAAQGIKKYTTPGGTAVVYYASVRVHFVQTKTNTKEEYVNPATKEIEKITTSYEITATVVKNKVGIPMRTARLQSVFGKGFSQPHSVLEILEGHKTVRNKGGGVFVFPEHLLPTDGEVPRGKGTLIAKMESDPAWLARLVAEAQDVIDQYRAGQDDTVDVHLDEEEQYDPITGEILGAVDED